MRHLCRKFYQAREVDNRLILERATECNEKQNEIAAS